MEYGVRTDPAGVNASMYKTLGTYRLEVRNFGGLGGLRAGADRLRNRFSLPMRWADRQARPNSVRFSTGKADTTCGRQAYACSDSLELGLDALGLAQELEDSVNPVKAGQVNFRLGRHRLRRRGARSGCWVRSAKWSRYCRPKAARGLRGEALCGNAANREFLVNFRQI